MSVLALADFIYNAILKAGGRSMDSKAYGGTNNSPQTISVTIEGTRFRIKIERVS